MKPIIMHAAFLVLFAASTLYSSAAAASGPAEDASSWPRRVLVTNDNGIDDTGMVELARALAKVTETHVVAATTDRSGTTNLMSWTATPPTACCSPCRARCERGHPIW